MRKILLAFALTVAMAASASAQNWNFNNLGSLQFNNQSTSIFSSATSKATGGQGGQGYYSPYYNNGSYPTYNYNLPNPYYYGGSKG